MLLNWKTAIVRLYMAVRKSINWPKHVIPWYDRWHCTSGNGATSWPLYVTSNNKLRKHSRKIVDRCQFTLGPCQLKIYVFFFRRVYYLYSFIAPRPNRQGYSLILWILKTAFSDFLVLPHQVKTRSGGYLGHGGEGIGGKERFPPRSIVPFSRPYADSEGHTAYDREIETMERQRNYMDPKWTDSCLLKISFSCRRSWSPHTATIPSPLCHGSIFKDFRVKAKVPFPQFLLHHGRDNPHYKSLLVVEVPETRRTWCSL